MPARGASTMQGVPPRKGRAPQDGRVSRCMWEVTGGLGPGGAAGAGWAGVVPPSCWAPEGGFGERARKGPGSAALPAAAGAAVAWHPCCCHGNNGGANLLMSPPQLRITILQRLIGQAGGSSGAGGGDQVPGGSTSQPSTPPAPAPPPLWVSALASLPPASLLSPPCSGHPFTPLRPCKDRRAGASKGLLPRLAPNPNPNPREDALPVMSPPHDSLLVWVLGLWTGHRSLTPR